MSAAVLTPSALSLIMTTYDGDQRRKGLALWGVVGSLGVAAGVVVGGALTTWVSWQLIFWVNVPIGAVALVAGLHAIPQVARTGTCVAAPLRPARCRHGHRRAEHPRPGPVGHQHPRLDVGSHDRHLRWVRGPAGAGSCVGAPRLRAAVPAARVEGPHPGLRHRRDARDHRHPRRRRVPGLDPAAGPARVHRAPGRSRLPAVRLRDHGRCGPRPARDGPRRASRRRARRPGLHGRRRCPAGRRARPRVVRRGPAARARRPRASASAWCSRRCR